MRAALASASDVMMWVNGSSLVFLALRLRPLCSRGYERERVGYEPE